MTEYLRVLSKVFMHMKSALRFQQIGHKSIYNYLEAANFENLGIEIWPGYLPRLSLKEGGPMLFIKPLHQVIRNTELVLDRIKLVRDIGIDRGIDYKAEVQSLVT